MAQNEQPSEERPSYVVSDHQLTHTPTGVSVDLRNPRDLHELKFAMVRLKRLVYLALYHGAAT